MKDKPNKGNKKIKRRYTLFTRVKDYYNTAKLVGVTTATALIAGLTLNVGYSNYHRFEDLGSFERAAMAWMIGSDKSTKRIEKQSTDLKSYISDSREIRKGLDEIRKEDHTNIEARIETLEGGGRYAEAARLKEIDQILMNTDGIVKNLYDTAEKELVEILNSNERLSQYSTLWRRAVKVQSFITYEFLSYARDRSEKLKKEGGLMNKSQQFFESVGRVWVEDVLGGDIQDSEKRYDMLRERIKMYSTAEIGKQGIANLMEYLNNELNQSNLGEGEKQVYMLVRDVVQQTGDTKFALDVVNYLQKGIIPTDIDAGSMKLLEGQKKLLDIIHETYGLIKTRSELVEEAESLGVDFEKGDTKRLDELVKAEDSLIRRMEESDSNMNSRGVDPKDPEYLQKIDDMKRIYKLSFGIALMLELAAGYFCARGLLEKRKNFKLRKEIDQVREDYAQLDGKCKSLIAKGYGGDKNAE